MGQVDGEGAVSRGSVFMPLAVELAPLSALGYAVEAARCMWELNGGHFTPGGVMEVSWSCMRHQGMLPATNRVRVENATVSAGDGMRPIVTLL